MGVCEACVQGEASDLKAGGLETGGELATDTSCRALAIVRDKAGSVRKSSLSIASRWVSRTRSFLLMKKLNSWSGLAI